MCIIVTRIASIICKKVKAVPRTRWYTTLSCFQALYPPFATKWQPPFAYPPFATKWQPPFATKWQGELFYNRCKQTHLSVREFFIILFFHTGQYSNKKLRIVTEVKFKEFQIAPYKIFLCGHVIINVLTTLIFSVVVEIELIKPFWQSDWQVNVRLFVGDFHLHGNITKYDIDKFIRMFIRLHDRFPPKKSWVQFLVSHSFNGFCCNNKVACKDVFRTLPNIYEGVFWENS